MLRVWYVLRFFYLDIEVQGLLSTTVPLKAKSDFRNNLKNWIFGQARTIAIVKVRLVRAQKNYGHFQLFRVVLSKV